MISPRGFIILSILQSLSLNGMCVDTLPKTSLVFIIDRTDSMGPVIANVSFYVKKIFDTVNESDNSPIENFVLVFFDDPNVTAPFVTSNPNEFKKRLDDITTVNGGDCPESALSGLETAVRASLPGSYVYLFTDAPASDYKKIENVKRIVQEKDCQVVFVITPLSCLHENEQSEKFLVYPKLAEVTSGQVFYLKPRESINEILNYVTHSIESRRITLRTGTFLDGVHSVEFTADSSTKSVCVSLTRLGSSPETYHLSVKKVSDEDDYDSDEDSDILYEIVNQGRFSILKFNTSSPGKYSVSFSCKERTDLLITASADVDFRHGFATKTATSFGDTVFNPIRDAKNVLFIKVFGKNAVLKNVILLDTSYNEISKMDLKLHDEKEKLYVSEPFDPPSIKFRISTIIGGDNGTITRYGHLVLETEKYEDRKPIVKISGNDLVNYDTELNLQCTVYGYPEPVITWHSVFYDGIVTKRIRKLEAVLDLEPPYTYYSKLKEYPKKNTTYQCSAENKLGEASEIFNVGVKLENYLKVGQLKSQRVEYGAQVILHCKVECFPPSNISWPLNKKKQTLLSKGIIILSSDNSTLTIKAVKKGAGGKYSCRVEQNDKLVVRSAKITHNGRMPKLTKPLYQQVYGSIGKDAVVTCGKINGYPKPEVKWKRQLFDSLSPDFEEFDDSSSNITQILIPKANKLDSAIYLCIAQNELGEATKYIHFFVEYEPTVKLEVRGTNIVEKGTEVNIKCEVKGMPIPQVQWFKDKTKLLASKFIKIFRDHSLRLTKAQITHSGEYTCEAKNKLNTASQSTKITVYSYKLNPPSNTYGVYEEEDLLNLKCGSYAYGVPKPSYRWMFENGTNTITLSDSKKWDPSSIKIEEGVLTIEEILPEQRGNYICEVITIAHVKDINITFGVDVQFAPTCVDSLQELSHATAVVGDQWLKIFCNVTGNPKPTYKWQKSDGVIIKNIAKVKKYEFEDNWLRIRNIEKADEYKYECIAKNNITGCAISRRTVKVHVQNSPPYESIRINEPMTIEFDKDVSISCPIRPYVTMGVSWYKDGALLRGNSKSNQLKLVSVDSSDSGVYTCRVNKVEPPEFENANITVNVIGRGPVFAAKHTSTIELYISEEFTLDCSVTEPSSVRNVKWWMDRSEIRHKTFIYQSNVYKKTEQYTCAIYNSFQGISRIFSIAMKDFTDCVIKIDKYTMPLMTVSGNWPNFRTINGFTTIPKLQSVVFTCPNQFTRFIRKQVTATCYGETKFFVREENRIFDLSDIQCTEEMLAIPDYIRNKECLGKETMLYKIRFVLNYGKIIIDVIEYCLDENSETLFAKYTMKSPAGFTPRITTMWNITNVPCYESCVSQNSRSCISSDCSYNTQSDKCCFTPRHLVSPKDLFPGPIQRSTYNRFNIVPHWSTCHTENWDEVEERIRQLRLTGNSNNDLVVYSGVAKKIMKNNCGKPLIINGQRVAKYLWKVVQHPGTKSSVAIVQPNVPGLEVKHFSDVIKCGGHICDMLPWMRGFHWSNIKKGYVYCCKLEDFISSFALNEIGFKKSFNSLLMKI